MGSSPEPVADSRDEEKTISSDFFDSKTKSVGHFIDSILPRYAGHFMVISSAKTGVQ